MRQLDSHEILRLAQCVAYVLVSEPQLSSLASTAVVLFCFSFLSFFYFIFLSFFGVTTVKKETSWTGVYCALASAIAEFLCFCNRQTKKVSFP